jgi:hypothetical protein
VVKEPAMEILVFVVVVIALDVAAHLYAADSRPSGAERRGP